MNVALIVPGFSANESDWCIPALRNLVKSLAGEDRVRVFTLRYPHTIGRYELFGAEVFSIGGKTRQGLGSGVVWARSLSLLFSEHRREPFDLVHSFWAGETGAVAAVVGRLLRVPVIVSLAGGELVRLREIQYGGRLLLGERLKTKLATRLAARVTTGSAYLQGLAGQSGIPEEKLRYAPLGVDTTAFGQPQSASTTSPPRLIQAASLVPVKDQVTLLRSAAILRDRGLEFRLEIAGSGPLRSRLQAMSSELGMNDRVTFLGELSHDLLPGFYQGATAYVQSSLHEAQGMALLEAAACGVPAVGSRVGVLPELEPSAAIGCDAGDARALADAIASALENPERQKARACAARKQVDTQYSLEKCVERFRSLYAEIK